MNMEICKGCGKEGDCSQKPYFCLDCNKELYNDGKGIPYMTPLKTAQEKAEEKGRKQGIYEMKQVVDAIITAYNQQVCMKCKGEVNQIDVNAVNKRVGCDCKRCIEYHNNIL